MFLTRIDLGKSQAASLNIADAYAWHQKLWNAFPDRPEADREFLFRITGAGMDFQVLMLSACEPTPPVWGHWQTKPVPDGFLAHRGYRFQVKANPTMRRNSDRRRLGIFHEDKLAEWFARKADRHGFAVAPGSLVIGAPLEEFFVKKGKRGKHIAVEFSGVLTVVDAERFAEAFASGIGSAKAFGFGMLMLQPLE